MNTDAIAGLAAHNVDFYVLVRSTGILVVEAPGGDPPETMLRIFYSLQDANRYKAVSASPRETKVMRTTLIDLWALLPNINSLSQTQFQAPVSVVISGMPAQGRVFSVRKIFSSHTLRS
jgi:hypothetical protein